MLSADAARARLSTIPAGSRIVVTGTNDGQPFTDEGVLVRDGESFLLQLSEVVGVPPTASSSPSSKTV
jgi:hypothetical protein